MCRVVQILALLKPQSSKWGEVPLFHMLAHDGMYPSVAVLKVCNYSFQFFSRLLTLSFGSLGRSKRRNTEHQVMS